MPTPGLIKPRASRFLAPCLTWRQYAANHHESSVVRVLYPSGPSVVKGCSAHHVDQPPFNRYIRCVVRLGGTMAEPWIAPLETGDPERAWDLFIERYRRLIFGAIRRYAAESDDVMDVFARVCEALRENDFAKLRGCAARPARPDRVPARQATAPAGRRSPRSGRCIRAARLPRPRARGTPGR